MALARGKRRNRPVERAAVGITNVPAAETDDARAPHDALCAGRLLEHPHDGRRVPSLIALGHASEKRRDAFLGGPRLRFRHPGVMLLRLWDEIASGVGQAE